MPWWIGLSVKILLWGIAQTQQPSGFCTKSPSTSILVSIRTNTHRHKIIKLRKIKSRVMSRWKSVSNSYSINFRICYSMRIAFPDPSLFVFLKWGTSSGFQLYIHVSFIKRVMGIVTIIKIEPTSNFSTIKIIQSYTMLPRCRFLIFSREY